MVVAALWETLAGVVVGAVLAGSFGLIQARRASAEAEKDRQHERQIRADERRHGRVESIYLDLIRLVQDGSTPTWNSATHDAFELAMADRIEEMGARLTVHGSLVIREHFTEWSGARARYMRAMKDQRRQQSGEPALQEEAAAAAKAARGKQLDALWAIEDAVRVELGTRAFDMDQLQAEQERDRRASRRWTRRRPRITGGGTGSEGVEG